MKYKIVAIDLDGTLLTDSKEVTNENIEVLNALSHRGVDIVIATGRRYYSAKQFVKKTGLENITILANNGTIVRNMSNDELLVHKYFDEYDFYSLIEEGKRKRLHAVTHVNKYLEGYDMVGEYASLDQRYCNYLHEAGNRYKKVKNLLEYEKPNTLAVVYPGELEALSRFKAEVEQKFDGKFNLYLMQKLVGVSPILEIINSRGSKWIALRDYANQRGISTEHIIAVGDDNNDLEMIEKSGLGIGMKNASEEVKAAADIITKYDNNDSGLGKTLREIFNI